MTSKQKKLDRTPVVSNLTRNRVYLPLHFCKHIGIEIGDSVQAELVGKKIVFQKVDVKKSN